MNAIAGWLGGGDADEGSPRARAVRFHGTRALITLLVAAVTYLVFPASPVVDSPILEVGSVAPDNVIAPFGYSVLKSPEELAKEQNDIARSVEPIFTFDSAALESVHHIDETMMTGYLCEYPSNDLVERAVRAGARQLAPRGDLVTSDLIAKAHRAGLQVVAWTVNEPEQMRRLVGIGVDGIMTDYPDRLVSVIEEAKVTGE